MAYRPLADEIRPQTLDEVVGQKHILGREGLLRRIIEGGDIPNLIFYGPSGTGKTTVANIIARRTNRPLHRLNATTASLQDVKDIIADVEQARTPLFTTGSEERSGMGFTIMESFMDVVKVRSTPGKGTQVTMRKRISPRIGGR